MSRTTTPGSPTSALPSPRTLACMQVVDEIFDHAAAAKMGIDQVGQVSGGLWGSHG